MTREQPMAWRELSRSQQAKIEDCVAKFEQQWHRRPFPDIGSFLPQDPNIREFAREELLVIDREFRERLEVGDSPAVDHARTVTAMPEHLNCDSQGKVNTDAGFIQLTSNYEAPHQ